MSTHALSGEIEWVVRRDIVERHDGSKHVHYLTKWTGDVDRTYCTACWTKNPEHATPWDESGARFAASLVGGWATPRAPLPITEGDHG